MTWEAISPKSPGQLEASSDHVITVAVDFLAFSAGNPQDSLLAQNMNISINAAFVGSKASFFYVKKPYFSQHFLTT